MHSQALPFIVCTIVSAVVGVFHCAQAAPIAKARSIIPKGTPSFYSKAQGFAVWFPAKRVKQRVVTEKKGSPPTLFIFEADSKSVTYAVLVIPRRSLDAMQKIKLKSPDVKLLKSNDLRLKGVPGRELWTSYMDGRLMQRSRIYITAKYSYDIYTNGSTIEMKKQSAQIDKMFDSFRIIPLPKE